MDTNSEKINSISTNFESHRSLYEIEAEFEYDVLFKALSTLSSSFVDHEIGWIQFAFVGNSEIVVTSVSHSYGLKYNFKSKYIGQGNIKILGKQLYDYMKCLPKLTVVFQIKEFSKLFVRCGKSIARVHLFQDQNTTQLFPSKSDSQIRIKGVHLDRFVSTFKDFIIYDDTRFYTRGALLWIEKNDQGKYHFVAVATDTTKLAHSILYEDFDLDHTDFKNIVVPKKSIEELKRISSANPDSEFVLKWSSSAHSFSCETENYLMYTMCLKGEFPFYESAFPQVIHHQATLNPQSLQEAIRRTMLFADEKKRRALHLIFEKDSLIIQGTADNREGEDVIEIKSNFKETFCINYNASQFLSVIGAIFGSQIQLSFESEKRPVKIVGEQPRGISVSYFLVPTRF